MKEKQRKLDYDYDDFDYDIDDNDDYEVKEEPSLKATNINRSKAEKHQQFSIKKVIILASVLSVIAIAGTLISCAKNKQTVSTEQTEQAEVVAAEEAETEEPTIVIMDPETVDNTVEERPVEPEQDNTVEELPVEPEQDNMVEEMPVETEQGNAAEEMPVEAVEEFSSEEWLSQVVNEIEEARLVVWNEETGNNKIIGYKPYEVCEGDKFAIVAPYEIASCDYYFTQTDDMKNDNILNNVAYIELPDYEFSWIAARVIPAEGIDLDLLGNMQLLYAEFE